MDRRRRGSPPGTRCGEPGDRRRRTGFRWVGEGAKPLEARPVSSSDWDRAARLSTAVRRPLRRESRSRPGPGRAPTQPCAPPRRKGLRRRRAGFHHRLGRALDDQVKPLRPVDQHRTHPSLVVERGKTAPGPTVCASGRAFVRALSSDPLSPPRRAQTAASIAAGRWSCHPAPGTRPARSRRT